MSCIEPGKASCVEAGETKYMSDDELAIVLANAYRSTREKELELILELRERSDEGE